MASELGAEKSRENSPWRWWNAGRANRGRPACASFPCIPYSLSRSSFLSLFLFPSLPPLFPLPRSLLFSYKRVYTCIRFSFEPKRLTVYRPTARFNALSLSSPLSTHLLYPLFTYLISSRDQFLQQRFIAIPFLSLPLFFPSSSLFLSNCLVWGRARRETFPFIPRSIFDRENLIKWMHSFSSGERGKRKIYNSPSLKAGG